MRHEIKIEHQYLMHILEEKKMFEVRKNDRDYQVGDIIRFLPIDSSTGYNVYDEFGDVPEYKITYIYTGNLVNQNHVVLGIKKA